MACIRYRSLVCWTWCVAGNRHVTIIMKWKDFSFFSFETLPKSYWCMHANGGYHLEMSREHRPWDRKWKSSIMCNAQFFPNLKLSSSFWISYAPNETGFKWSHWISQFLLFGYSQWWNKYFADCNVVLRRLKFSWKH